MTADLLTRDPNDTGEIPAVDPGPDTRNLAPYIGLPPALRRPTVEVPALAGCRATLDGELVPTGFQAPTDPRIPHPDPLPPPPPPTPGWHGSEDFPAPSRLVDVRTHVGRHRRPSRWDWLTVPLSMAVQRIRRPL